MDGFFLFWFCVSGFLECVVTSLYASQVLTVIVDRRGDPTVFTLTRMEAVTCPLFRDMLQGKKNTHTNVDPCIWIIHGTALACQSSMQVVWRR